VTLARLPHHRRQVKPHVYCDACGARPRGNMRTCPECGAPLKRVRDGVDTRSRRSSPLVREDVEVEVREALYGRRTGAVERLSGR